MNTEPQMLVGLESSLKLLKLPVMLKNYSQIALSSLEDKYSYEQYLYCLAERELEERTNKRRNEKIGIGVKNLLKDEKDLLSFAEKAKQQNKTLSELELSEDELKAGGYNKSVANTIVDMTNRNAAAGTTNTMREMINDMKDIDHSCKDQKGLMLGGRAGGGGGGEEQSDKRDQVKLTV